MSRRPLAALCAAAALLVVPASASADIGLSDCDNPASSQPFAPWLDYTNYFLAPDGSFDDGGSGWALDGASANGTLSLGSGDSATSPSVCVGLEHPTFRFFVRRTGGSALSSMTVRVVLDDGSSLPVGVIGGSSSWQPSPIMLVAANLLPLISTGTSTDVAFRFTANSGSWQVDDVYVDPRGSH
jgi:hypothetical protein